MRETIADRAVTKLLERRDRVKAKLQERYKGTKPFRTDPISMDEQLWAYNQLSPEDMQYLISNHGNDTVNEMIKDMETEKQRRGL